MRTLRAIWFVVFPFGLLWLLLLLAVIAIARRGNEHNLWPLLWAWLLLIGGAVGIVAVGSLVEKWDRYRDERAGRRRR